MRGVRAEICPDPRSCSLPSPFYAWVTTNPLHKTPKTKNEKERKRKRVRIPLRPSSYASRWSSSSRKASGTPRSSVSQPLHPTVPRTLEVVRTLPKTLSLFLCLSLSRERNSSSHGRSGSSRSLCRHRSPIRCFSPHEANGPLSLSLYRIVEFQIFRNYGRFEFLGFWFPTLRFWFGL